MAHFIVLVIAFLFACGFVFLGIFVSELAVEALGRLARPLGERGGIVIVLTVFLFLYIRHVARLKTENQALHIIVEQYEKAVKKLKQAGVVAADDGEADRAPE